ncbi:MAG: hypothetical protein HQ559_04460, partial [Lentisphaerae bacterium]|nr:hypothetical protein [Lentisphaerota bacterium]
RLPLQKYRQEWTLDGFRDGSPNYTGVTQGVSGTTVRRCYGVMLSPREDEGEAKLASLFTWARQLGAMPLDRVKDLSLDLPDPMAGAQWAAKDSAEATTAIAILRARIGLKYRFGNSGFFSMGYHYSYAKSVYPKLAAVTDDPKALSAATRKELRRLSAFYACDMNSVDTFPYGTGFHLNNPNMTIMAIEARLKASALVKNHPRFREWGARSRELLADYFRRFTKASGAPYENPHYTLGVTYSWAGIANRLLVDNGLGDAFDSELFRKSFDFLLNWLTPPDPRFNGHRVVLPVGNGSYQSVPPEFTDTFVNYYKDSHPELAGMLQWYGNQTMPEGKKTHLVDELVPPLASAAFDEYGVFFRHGFGTPYETFFHILAGSCDGHNEWESDQMSYTLYAKGQPINLDFGNGYFPMFCRPWLRNRVSFDMMFEPSERNATRVVATSLAPETDYLRAFRDVDRLRPLSEYPLLNDKRSWTPEEGKQWSQPAPDQDIPKIRWFRQVLFLKDPDPKSVNYFVLRDDFSGRATRPTYLNLWFLANEMTRDGDVFHFDGQCEVDMDVFVHTPAGCEPQTAEYGHQQQPYRRDTGFDPKYHPDGKLWESQLLLRLRQAPGSGYLVVLYPRLKEGDPPAAFERLADGVVRVETPVGEDFVLLSPFPLEYTHDRLSMSGTACSVRFGKDGGVVVVN